MSRSRFLRGPPPFRGGRKQRLEKAPLGIGQVAGIGFGSHPLFYVRIGIMEQTVSRLRRLIVLPSPDLAGIPLDILLAAWNDGPPLVVSPCAIRDLVRPGRQRGAALAVRARRSSLPWATRSMILPRHPGRTPQGLPRAY